MSPRPGAGAGRDGLDPEPPPADRRTARRGDNGWPRTASSASPDRSPVRTGAPRGSPVPSRSPAGPPPPTAARTAAPRAGFCVQPPRRVIRAMGLDQFLEAAFRNMLQNLVQHGMLVGHGVAPLSGPDRLKRSEGEESQRRAPVMLKTCRTAVDLIRASPGGDWRKDFNLKS